MSEMSWERTAEARAALTAIVSDPELGVAVLSNPRTMSNLLKDLLPDAPREKAVLVAAAEAGLAETLRDHVAQGLDSDTAVRLTASRFSTSTPFTPEACNWVAGEFAVAMGISQPNLGGAATVATPQSGPAQFSPGPVAPPSGPPQYQPGPAQFPPGPAQYQPGPAQFPPGPVVWPGSTQYQPGSAQYQPGPVVSPSGPVVPPPAPGQFVPGQVPFGYSPSFGQPRQKTNRLAIVSLVCGISQFPLGFLLVPGVLAFIFGLVSFGRMKQAGEAGRGMAVTGVVLGAVGFIGWLILYAAIGAAHQGN